MSNFKAKMEIFLCLLLFKKSVLYLLRGFQVLKSATQCLKAKFMLTMF